MPEHSGWYDADPPPMWIVSDEEDSGYTHDNVPSTYLQTMRTEDINKDVLVVDDDPHLCEIITDVLETDGHTTRTAANGQEALERIRERKPQLILLDLMMPVMNGWELAEALKANPDWADIPVVFVTAAHSGIQGRHQEIGAKAIINKPFDIDVLAQVVQTYAV